jgi:hypothetical protein
MVVTTMYLETISSEACKPEWTIKLSTTANSIVNNYKSKIYDLFQRFNSACKRIKSIHPDSVKMIPSYAGIIPHEPGIIPYEVGIIPYEVGSIPIDAGIIPPKAGRLPAKEEIILSEAGALPAKAGELPFGLGMSPFNDGTITPVQGFYHNYFRRPPPKL